MREDSQCLAIEVTMATTHYKHSFLWLVPDKMDHDDDQRDARPDVLNVTHDLTISWNGGPPHGSAFYKFDQDKGRGVWEFSFHHTGVEEKAFSHKLYQIAGADVYMWASRRQSRWNTIAIPIDARPM